MTEPHEILSRVSVPRVRPNVAVASVCLIAYMSVFYGMAQASGIDYQDWFASAANALHSALFPLIAGSALLLVFMAWSRWNAVWRDPYRLPTNRLHATRGFRAPEMNRCGCRYGWPATMTRVLLARARRPPDKGCTSCQQARCRRRVTCS